MFIFKNVETLIINEALQQKNEKFDAYEKISRWKLLKL